MADIDRAGITADLAYRYTLLLDQSGIPALDTGDGLGPVLDTVQAVADANVELSDQTLALFARYLTLDVIVERLATMFDASDADGNMRLNQLFTNAKALRDGMQATIGWLALGELAQTAASQVVRITAPVTYARGGDEVASWS